METTPSTPVTAPPAPPIPPISHKEDHVIRGICFALAAYFLFGVMQAGAKVLSESHHIMEVAFYRSLISLVPMVIYLAVTNKWYKLKSSKPKALAFRGIFGSFSLIITFTTFHYLPMAEATVILFTAIILTPALAFFFLKEHIGWHRWSAIIIGLIGVIMMVRPSGDAPLIGICIAFVTAFMHATINITLRYLKTESPFAITFYFILCGVLIPAVAMPFVAHMPEPHEWALFLLVGASGGLGQYCLTSAFRNAPASLAAMFNYTGLIWATLFDIAIWKNVPGINVFIGGVIILSANLYIIHRERVRAREKA